LEAIVKKTFGERKQHFKEWKHLRENTIGYWTKNIKIKANKSIKGKLVTKSSIANAKIYN